MSADNWEYCPRCTRREEVRLGERQVEVDALYGKVSVEEFNTARAALDEEREAFTNRRATFREDYEFYGADTGVVKVEYSGECTICGLKLSFKDSRDIPEVDKP